MGAADEVRWGWGDRCSMSVVARAGTHPLHAPITLPHTASKHVKQCNRSCAAAAVWSEQCSRSKERVQ